jgi:hypothetical protein
LFVCLILMTLCLFVCLMMMTLCLFGCVVYICVCMHMCCCYCCNHDCCVVSWFGPICECDMCVAGGLIPTHMNNTISHSHIGPNHDTTQQSWLQQ